MVAGAGMSSCSTENGIGAFRWLVKLRRIVHARFRGRGDERARRLLVAPVQVALATQRLASAAGMPVTLKMLARMRGLAAERDETRGRERQAVGGVTEPGAPLEEVRSEADLRPPARVAVSWV